MNVELPLVHQPINESIRTCLLKKNQIEWTSGILSRYDRFTFNLFLSKPECWLPVSKKRSLDVQEVIKDGSTSENTGMLYLSHTCVFKISHLTW